MYLWLFKNCQFFWSKLVRKFRLFLGYWTMVRCVKKYPTYTYVAKLLNTRGEATIIKIENYSWKKGSMVWGIKFCPTDAYVAKILMSRD